MVGKYYKINIASERVAGESHYVGPNFDSVEEAVDYAQNRGWISYDEEEDKYVDNKGLEIVEFFD